MVYCLRLRSLPAGRLLVSLVEPRERLPQPLAFLPDCPVDFRLRQRRQAIEQAELCRDGEIEEAIPGVAQHRRSPRLQFGLPAGGGV